MNNRIFPMGAVAIAAAVVAIAPTTANAQTVSKQAEQLLNTNPTNSLYEQRYDATSRAYGQQAKGFSLGFDDWFAINSFVNNERAAFGTDKATLQELTALDTADLTWKAGAHGVEVFFINEGAGYRNQLGYSYTAPVDADRNSMKQFWDDEVSVVWKEVSSKNSILSNGSALPGNSLLALGEGYEIGEVKAGETVNFFIRNQWNGMGDVFDSLDAEKTQNGDGLQHVTTYQYGEFLVLAYEDIYNGGDKDYNDVVFAVRGLVDTQSKDIPEPSSTFALLGAVAAGLAAKRLQLVG